MASPPSKPKKIFFVLDRMQIVLKCDLQLDDSSAMYLTQVDILKQLGMAEAEKKFMANGNTNPWNPSMSTSGELKA